MKSAMRNANGQRWLGQALFALLLSSLSFACGSLEVAGDTPDGGPNGNDAGASCSLGLVIPALATVGETVELGVEVLPAGQAGFQSFEWTVNVDGVDQSTTPLADPADRVSFTPQIAGLYLVQVDGSGCFSGVGQITVTENGALFEDYRLRVVPLSGAPLEDFSVRIYGGANSGIPATSLASGVLANGTLTDSTGTGVPAYLRARKRGTLVDTDYEGFADANGAFSLRLPAGRYDLLAMPSGGLLPAIYLEDLAISDIATTIAMPAPVTLVGQVRTAADAPVEGASVSLVVDGAPTTSALSGADGSFAVLGQSGLLTGLRVAPVENSGMPALRAEGLQGQSVTVASDVIIRYATPAVNAAVDVSLAGGGAAAGAQVEWRAQSAQFATVDLGVSEDIAGELRVKATADAAGHAEAPLAAVVADVVMESFDATEARVLPAHDWGASPTTVSSLEALVPVSVGVAFAAAAAEGARVLAVPKDSLAPQASAYSAMVLSSGTATLSLVRGGNYELIASDLNKGTIWTSVADVAGGTVVPSLVLPGNIKATGYVSIDGEAARSARVSLYCASCGGDEATRVRAQAVTDSTGRYTLRVADPGIATP